MEEPASTTTSSSSSSSRYSSANVSPPGNPVLPPEGPTQPMEFLARSWSLSALEVCKAIGPSPPTSTTKTSIKLPEGIPEDDIVVVLEQLQEQSPCVVPANGLAGNPFSFATAVTSQLVLERIMSQSVAHSQQQMQQQNQQEISPRTSGRLSHSSGPLNAQSCGGSFSDSPPLSPSDMDELKFCRLSNTVQSHYRGKTVGRWLKDRREKKKQDTRTHNAQLHAAISVAGVAAAVAAIAAATAGSSKDEQARIDLAVVSAATLVAAQCVEAAESLGADREVLTSVVNSAVNVRNAGDIMTLNAAAATALRGAATLKARANKDVWNIAAVIPVEKGLISNNNPKHKASPLSGDLPPEDDFLGVCSQELVSRGGELLKRTRKGDLHWKLVSVYINRFGQVMVKMKSRHVAGTITKKKKNVILDVCKDIPAWPGRHLLEGGEYRRYFGLRTADRGVIEFECRNEREYEIWTKGVSRLLAIAREKKRRPLLI